MCVSTRPSHVAAVPARLDAAAIAHRCHPWELKVACCAGVVRSRRQPRRSPFVTITYLSKSLRSTTGTDGGQADAMLIVDLGRKPASGSTLGR